MIIAHHVKITLVVQHALYYLIEIILTCVYVVMVFIIVVLLIAQVKIINVNQFNFSIFYNLSLLSKKIKYKYNLKQVAMLIAQHVKIVLVVQNVQHLQIEITLICASVMMAFIVMLLLFALVKSIDFYNIHNFISIFNNL